MFFPIYLILFCSIPFFFEGLSEKDKKIHLNLLLFIIFLLSVLSTNGPDLTTYQKNYYMWESNSAVKYIEYFFYGLTALFRRFDLSFFIYQLVVKSFFFVGFYFFIKSVFEKKFDYLFIIIFSSIYFIPIASITNLYQMAAIGLFLLLISFKEFRLIRDIPIVLIIISMHKSGIAVLLIYFLNYILQFRRIKFVKTILNVIFFNSVPFTIFIFFNADDIKSYLSNFINTADLEISFFSFIWFVLYFIMIIIFLTSKKNFKKILSLKDYNFLISSGCFFIFILISFSISNIYALRFLYYGFPFFFLSCGLISKISWLKFSNLKNLYTASYICLSLFFIGIWYGTANHKWSFENYTLVGEIKLFCHDIEKCSSIFNSDPNIYRIIRKHLKLGEYAVIDGRDETSHITLIPEAQKIFNNSDIEEINSQIDKQINKGWVEEKFKKDSLLQK